jgi:hypothetical protein
MRALPATVAVLLLLVLSLEGWQNPSVGTAEPAQQFLAAHFQLRPTISGASIRDSTRGVASGAVSNELLSARGLVRQ